MIGALKVRFPNSAGPPAQDICYATENRQRAVKAVASRCDLLLVVGSANSSNSNRLVEVAKNAGLSAHLIENERDIRKEWLEQVRAVGVTAGASAPEYLVDHVVRFLKGHGYERITEVETVLEDVRFALPPELVPLETGNAKFAANS